jgi:hypothetical protein
MDTPPRPDHPWKLRLLGSAHVSWKPYAVVVTGVILWSIDYFVFHQQVWEMLFGTKYPFG